jgi:putative hemolysin
MKTTRLIAAVLMAGSLMVACGGDDAPVSTNPPISDGGAQVANPASQYCIDQGGTLEIVDETAGQVGYCNLPDGTRIEEWEYFNASQSPSTTG